MRPQAFHTAFSIVRMLNIHKGHPVLRFATVLGLLLWGLLSLPSSASAEVIQKPEFSLTLPDGWEEIPKEKLEVFNLLAASNRLGRGKHEPYECVFQLDPREPGTSSSYVMVRWLDKGKRISHQQLRSWPKVDISKVVNDKRILRGETVLDAGRGRFRFDEASHTLWLDGNFGPESMDKRRKESAAIPTEIGLLSVEGEFISGDASAHRLAYHQIVKSVVISPEIAYRARKSDDLLTGDPKPPEPKLVEPTPTQLWQGYSLCFLMGVLLLIVIKRKLRAKPAADTTLE